MPADIVGDQAAYLQPEMKVMLAVLRGRGGLDRAAAEGRSLEVVETEPTIKSQTAASSYKPAMLSNGVRTMVPPLRRHRHQDRGDDRRRVLCGAGEGLSGPLMPGPRIVH